MAKVKNKAVEHSTLTLLPCAPCVCQECAVDHDPVYTHDKRSLYYQQKFHQEHGKWPTWATAMHHCTEEMKAITYRTLCENKLWKVGDEVDLLAENVATCRGCAG